MMAGEITALSVYPQDGATHILIESFVNETVKSSYMDGLRREVIFIVGEMMAYNHFPHDIKVYMNGPDHINQMVVGACMMHGLNPIPVECAVDA